MIIPHHPKTLKSKEKGNMKVNEQSWEMKFETAINNNIFSLIILNINCTR